MIIAVIKKILPHQFHPESMTKDIVFVDIVRLIKKSDLTSIWTETRCGQRNSWCLKLQQQQQSWGRV